MNILFLCRTYTIGGVNVVTQYLAERFMLDGHSVSILSLSGKPKGMEERYHPNLNKYEGVGDKFCVGNIRAIRSLLKEQPVDIVINNWGMRPLPVIMFKIAQIGMAHHPKIISIYHNDPTTNGLLQKISIAHHKTSDAIRKLTLDIASKAVVILSVLKFRLTYKMSDKFVLLSKSFIKTFKDFTFIDKGVKIAAISDPITIDKGSFIYESEKKQDEILYVGRLDEEQKRISRIIEIWNNIEKRFPDWHLTIVGDGPARKMLENLIDKYALKNVAFEGYQQPDSYYRRASLLLLTSEFEGFGLVIVEGMQYGVVPIVYGSYPAVYDIIENGKDGIIIPYHDEGFDVQEATRLVELLLNDRDKRLFLAERAMENSNKYSLRTIANEWYQLFETL